MSWCWRCGVEHLSWATECSHCGGELHSSPPPDGPLVAPDDTSHETLEIDLSGMDAGARELFLLFLDGAGIHHELRGLLLSIAEADEERTRELLETITADTLVELDPADPMDDSEWSLTVAAMMHPSSGAEPMMVLAGTSRRVVAALVGQIVWALAGVVVLSVVSLAVAGDPPGVLVWCTVALPILGDVWLTAVYGSTPGKYLLDMRVVNERGAAPGWRCSIIRILVMTWPALVSWVPGPAGQLAAWVVLPWTILLIVTIARDPQHQGLHDRAAGTRVVDGRHRSPLRQ